ncbi:hypothetical protein [Segnochrobactrum spirostomi]|uniref:Uncharacterized protein n=1 Tax=Segnochrobactrum spirostomi TaxID=2608987 RepID=A0A6A7Y6P9_9HYPH|nr:hypothetical protein [Segnochrobactrum spirostomi]MQT14375.1 hypothetical protein [Segnochrobactrum spirostomi]
MWLYRFEDDAARAVALDALHEVAAGSTLAVDLVTAPAVWGDPDPETGARDIATPAVTLPGAWVISGGAIEGATLVATIDPATMAATDCTAEAIVGARIVPMWAGSADAGISIAAPAAPPPPAISRRQFFEQAARLGLITEAEALAAAARGDIPAAIEAVIAALPADKQFGARMLVAAAGTFEAATPLAAAIGAATGIDIDAFFRAAAAL